MVENEDLYETNWSLSNKLSDSNQQVLKTIVESSLIKTLDKFLSELD